MRKRKLVQQRRLAGLGVAMLLLLASAGEATANSRCYTDYHADNTAVTTCAPATTAAAPAVASGGGAVPEQSNTGSETLRFPGEPAATVPEHRPGCNAAMTYCEK
jgi:hypothetical protein